MRKRGKFGVALLAISASILLSACSFSFSLGGSKFDADEYVQATLDSIYRGEHEKYIEYTKMSKEEAEDQHDRMVSAKADDFLAACENSSVSDGVRADLENFFEDVFMEVKYEVQEAEKDGDDYNVQVIVSPCKVLSANMDELEDVLIDFLYNADYASYTEEQEVYDDLMSTVIEAAEGWMDNISYGSDVSVDVNVFEAEEGGYNIEPDDLIEIDNNMIEY